MGGSGTDYGEGIALAADGSVYTTGWFGGTADFDAGPGTFHLTSAGSSDIFVSKLNSAGDFVWARRLGGAGEDRGFKIAFENWTGFRAYPFHGTNIAYRPEAWDLMFDAVDSDALGIEFDPSHLHFQMMDYVGLVQDYGEKIYHVHAKDTEIHWDSLRDNGIFSSGWWRFRVPGWGEINWMRFISALQDVEYEGGIAIEHEDPVYCDDRFDEGLQLGYNTLAPLLVR